MRVQSGSTDQVLHFVAVDATDLSTRETGLSSFTVYRKRKAGSATAWTTPTITEASASNMPGVYGLLIDEDTTIDSGDDEQQVVLHITHAGMAPVTITYELFRPKYAAGSVIPTLTGDAYARLGAPVGASISADIAGVQADTNDIQTRIPAALVSGRIDASVGAMANNVMTAAAAASDLTTELQSGLATAASLATVAGYIDTEVAAIKAKTDNLPASPAAAGDIPSAAAIADAVWDEATSGHATAGSTGAALSAAGSAGDPWSTAIPGSYSSGQAGYIVGTNLNATVSSRMASASYTAPLDAAGVRSAVGLASANLDTQLDAIPTATENADALLNRDMSAGTDSGSATVRTPRQALRFIRNKWGLSGTTLTVTKEDDTTTSWTAVVTTTAGADPITGSDPASS